MTLTIYFDGQFWIGIVEMYENNKLKVCKHTFGTEPKDSEILDFIFHDMIPLLNNTSGIKNSNDNKKTKAINPKRLIRLTAKEIKNQGVSNKSFEALRIELEQKKKMKFKAKSSNECMLLNNYMIIKKEWESTPFITTISGQNHKK
ncbi:YjdF family protein [Bacillus sp. H1a]|uniref:YjdF family protein n=1 Tax=Bacillus sp. H1a TaxID=1397276 RepID=UPI000468C8D2|nr:YjdF family protein [Bacillus sp. H1a]